MDKSERRTRVRPTSQFPNQNRMARGGPVAAVRTAVGDGERRTRVRPRSHAGQQRAPPAGGRALASAGAAELKPQHAHGHAVNQMSHLLPPEQRAAKSKQREGGIYKETAEVGKAALSILGGDEAFDTVVVRRDSIKSRGATGAGGSGATDDSRVEEEAAMQVPASSASASLASATAAGAKASLEEWNRAKSRRLRELSIQRLEAEQAARRSAAAAASGAAAATAVPGAGGNARAEERRSRLDKGRAQLAAQAALQRAAAKERLRLQRETRELAAELMAERRLKEADDKARLREWRASQEYRHKHRLDGVELKQAYPPISKDTDPMLFQDDILERLIGFRSILA